MASASIIKCILTCSTCKNINLLYPCSERIYYPPNLYLTLIWFFQDCFNKIQKVHAKKKKKWQHKVIWFFIPKKGIFNHNLSHKPSAGVIGSCRHRVKERIRLNATRLGVVGDGTHKTSWRKWGLYLCHGRPHMTTCGGLGGSRQPPHTFQLHLGSHKVRTRSRPPCTILSQASVWKGKIFNSWRGTWVIQILSPRPEAKPCQGETPLNTPTQCDFAGLLRVQSWVSSTRLEQQIW